MDMSNPKEPPTVYAAIRERAASGSLSYAAHDRAVLLEEVDRLREKVRSLEGPDCEAAKLRARVPESATIEQAKAEERAAVVAWLRCASNHSPSIAPTAAAWAGLIERGEHVAKEST